MTLWVLLMGQRMQSIWEKWGIYVLVPGGRVAVPTCSFSGSALVGALALALSVAWLPWQ